MAKKKKETDKQKIARLEKQLKASRAAHKKTIQRHRASTLTYESLMLRKKGTTWKKIAKKLKVPESSIRLATQKRYKARWLRGRWSDAKLDASEKMDMHMTKFLADAKKNQHGLSYEEYVRATKS
jgi:hypothetical protein